LESHIAVGFFYGASQDGGSRCGAGVVLKCPVLGVYSIKMNCGHGTNSQGEILALWCILFFAHFKQISCLQLVGDSKVIVDWFSYKNNMQVISLQPWMERIRQLSSNFQELKIQHIYRSSIWQLICSLSRLWIWRKENYFLQKGILLDSIKDCTCFDKVFKFLKIFFGRDKLS
jgi:ribonuclease HI